MCWLSTARGVGCVGRKQCLRWQKQQWWCCCHPTEDRNPHNNDNDDDLTTVMIKLEIDVWKRRRQRNRGRDAVWTRSPPESHHYPCHWIRIVVGWWVRWNLIYVSKPFEFVHIFLHICTFSDSSKYLSCKYFGRLINFCQDSISPRRTRGGIGRHIKRISCWIVWITQVHSTENLASLYWTLRNVWSHCQKCTLGIKCEMWICETCDFKDFHNYEGRSGWWGWR